MKKFSMVVVVCALLSLLVGLAGPVGAATMTFSNVYVPDIEEGQSLLVVATMSLDAWWVDSFSGAYALIQLQGPKDPLFSNQPWNWPLIENRYVNYFNSWPGSWVHNDAWGVYTPPAGSAGARQLVQVFDTTALAAGTYGVIITTLTGTTAFEVRTFTIKPDVNVQIADLEAKIDAIEAALSQPGASGISRYGK